MNYTQFIERKRQLSGMQGFEPLWMPDFLFDFQSFMTGWAIKKGRSALLADCGLGKSPMQLVWAENVVRKSGKPVLIAAPLAVSHQMVGEGDKFGVECVRSIDGKPKGRVTVTNYERLHHFNPDDFSGMVCEEASILKNFNGAIRRMVTEFMRKLPYRLLCTATAAPNDYVELGTCSDALGELGYTDMITRFFKEDTIKDYLGWGRKAYRFRGYSEEQFWRWICSWARVCRKPSDLGFDDGRFVLPELIEKELIVQNTTPREGMLFSAHAGDLREQRAERRVSLGDRCEVASDLCRSTADATVLWCHLNDEGDTLEKMIPDVVQVSGSMSDEEKEEKLLGFQSGEIKRLIIKPKIGAWGLNWQHCHNVITFPSHSWEQYYQSIRRCYRFGQMENVTVTTVASEGESGVLKNMQRKADQADKMFAAISRHANESLKIDRTETFSQKGSLPSWI